MLFTDLVYAFFLPVVFLCYWALRRRLQRQNALLVLVSYFFYGWWDWRFLGLIILTTAVTYAAALGTPRHRWLCGAAIVFNLLVLLFFKYFNFFGENLQRLAGLFGWQLDWFTVDVLLPVGISFYTFQAIGYIADVRRGIVAPQRNYITFSAFIAFFPQLVAGPIERAGALMPHLARPRSWDYARAVSGMRMILWGLLKKLVVADVAGWRVDTFYRDGLADGFTPFTATVITVLFTVQIYFDFSAYSEIARGSARLLGIELMRNFRTPYFSRNIAEFWRRWHISLMQWFRDYVYIPLGGNRKGLARTCANIFIVFLLSGIWHGAAWNFVLWGAYWGVLMILYRVFGKRTKIIPEASAADIAGICVTMVAVTVGFLIFRCESAEACGEIMARSFLPLLALGTCVILLVRLCCAMGAGRRRVGALAAGLLAVSCVIWPGVFFALARNYYVCAIPVILWVEWRERAGDYILEKMPRRQWLRIGCYLAAILLICLCEDPGSPFIYFRF